MAHSLKQICKMETTERAYTFCSFSKIIVWLSKYAYNYAVWQSTEK